MIELLNVNKKYEDQHALDHLSLTINDGELFVLVGPSGSGKTTLLKTINRLVIPTSGQIKIDGKDVADMNLQQLRRQIGYVLQTGALFPNMTVAENASVQLDNLKWPVEKRHARIAELMTAVGLDPEQFLDRMPSELSGGEAQRVGIVRALACKPRLVLMDEPFSALDPVSRRQLQQIVINLHRDLDSTIVFVTHDMHEALRLADRIAVVHDGKLQQIGTPTEILSEPANAFVSNFFADEQQTDQLLGQVLASGFGRPVKPGEPGTKMVKGQSIFEWATALQQSQIDQVIVADQVLTDHDLIDYLASLEMEGDSH
ncbi:glycine betaine/carnitine/choline ABC transporter ATP-binding protein [Secundilactobacillus pentosiphilus]|uniref:ABC-type quaternary amine transporter n=1 Tax=Secundilactobacillus pentosiphilus TaxID=1714682 RepID=A0A1Z5IMU2_9LACO|nr:ABC transporter ATP-binding protein [Secundilactobacillus pentosiphilus]GAX03069.1 glycine betaine/carnitine/choline ABC transporter ATP-binding protein [Secundilactobacillus pentosiphilus]